MTIKIIQTSQTRDNRLTKPKRLTHGIRQALAMMAMSGVLSTAVQAQDFPADGVIELSALNTTAATGAAGLVINGINENDRSGYSVSTAGDVNGDGVDDLLIGAPDADANGNFNNGLTYVVFGSSTGVVGSGGVLELSALNNTTAATGTAGLVINGIDAFDTAGTSVSTAGDVNGDDIDDLLIGADGADPNGGASGETYVVFGSSTGVVGNGGVLDLSALNNTAVATGTAGLVINGINAADASGYSVSTAGDVNGDGIDDLLIGADGADPGGNSYAGETYVVFGSSTGVVGNGGVLELADLNNTTVATGTAGLLINGIDAFDFSGISVSSAGDVNDDGIDDLLIGADGALANGNTSAGEIYVVFGSSTGVVGNGGVLELSALNDTTVATGTAGLLINGISAYDDAGNSVSMAGDVNGDGIDDLLIGAEDADVNGNFVDDTGEIYVVFGSSTGVVGNGGILDLSALNDTTAATGTAGLLINGIDTDDGAGNSVSAAGDVNGDGVDDLLIGAQYADPNGLSSGETYVVFGSRTGVVGSGGVLDLSALNNSTVMTGTPGLVINGINAVDLSGATVSAAGDVNGDGIDDLLIGAPDADVNNNLAGQTYVVFGVLTNSAPIVTVPAAQTTNEDIDLLFPGNLSVADADDDELTVMLSLSDSTRGASIGSLTAGSTTGVTGDGTDTLTIVGTPAVVNAALNGLSFTPAADINGSFVLTINTDDGMALAVENTIDITVTAVNDAPSFNQSGDQTLLEDAGPQTLSDFVTAIADGDPELTQTVTIAVINNNNALFSAQPTLTDGELTYTPTANANGTATVTITATDDGDATAPNVSTSSQTFDITITAVNDAPSFTQGGDQAVLEDAGAQKVGGFVTAVDDGDPEADQSVTISTTNDNNALFSVQPTITNGELTYTPAPDANGTAVVTITATDDGGTDNGGVDTAADTFVITVTAVNDAPSFVQGGDQTVLEDAGAQTVSSFVTAVDDGDPEADQSVTISTTNDNNALFSVQPSITNGELTYTPTSDANGTAVVTITASDNGGTDDGGVDTTTDTFNITVTPVNDVPSFTVGPDQIVDDNVGPQTIDPWATGVSAGPVDESGQPLTFNVVGNTNPAILANAPSVDSSGALSFEPALDAQGSTTVTVELMDDGGTADGGVDTSATQSFDIQVNATNADLVLSIANTATPPVFPGAEYSYIVDIMNNGPGIAANTTVDIQIPINLNVIDTGGCVIDNGDGSLSWTVGTLDPSAGDQCVFDVQVFLAGTITVTGSAESDLIDPTPANDTAITDTIVAEVVAVPTLSTWAMGLMAVLLGLFGWRRKHQL